MHSITEIKADITALNAELKDDRSDKAMRDKAVYALMQMDYGFAYGEWMPKLKPHNITQPPEALSEGTLITVPDAGYYRVESSWNHMVKARLILGARLGGALKVSNSIFNLPIERCTVLSREEVERKVPFIQSF